ncbi:MAG: HEAT repeat domain-containing protein [Pirellulales bacterium]|nr:HEAT repeat domain-containing protein [Pirellulales bacterium]
MKSSTAAASVTLLLTLGPAFALAAEKAADGERKVEQGLGYWEKLDPNVDYQARLPRIKPCEPKEALQSFQLAPELRIELVAAEPLVCDVVDMAFDENYRLWVCELISYNESPARSRGRVSFLDDTDGDGRFDKSTVFADELSWPAAVLPFDGGVFITCAPDVLYLKDTDGDGRADLREVFLAGFRTANSAIIPNSLRWGLDNRVHGMSSMAGGVIEPVKWKQSAAGRGAVAGEIRGSDFSLDPRSGELRLESGGSQHGLAYDPWGRKFESSNSAPIEMVMYDYRYLARNPYLAAPSARVPIWKTGSQVYRTSPLEPWRMLRSDLRQKGTFAGGPEPASGYFTSACGLTIYNGHAWPADYRGNAFVCEGAGNLVHRMRLDPDGVGFAAFRTEREKEFLTSRDVWFRPVQLADAPDGNLYLADMYREVFEIREAVPTSAQRHIDLTTGNNRGRIYRIVAADAAPPQPVRLGSLSAAELVALLAHPNLWHRRTAARLLYQRPDAAAVEPLRQMTAEAGSPLGRMHALYVLDGLNALTAEIVLARLDDEHPRVREHAIRLAEQVLADAPAIREKLYHLSGDDDLRVRYQAAFTLGEIPGAQATAALARIAARDAADPWVRLAVLSSCNGRAGDLLARLAEDRVWRREDAHGTILEQLAEQTGLQAQGDQVAVVFRTLEALGGDEARLAERVVRGVTRGLEKAGSALRQQFLSGGKAAEALGQLLDQAKGLAAAEDEPPEKRAEAVRTLSLAPLDDVSELLEELLSSRQPQAVQMAALATLGRFPGDAVARMIVDHWLGFSPQVRGEAAETLFARPERIAALLAAVQEKLILPSQLDPARIQFLLTHPDAQLRDLARELFGGVKLARREEVVASYRDALAVPADAARGREVFRKECAACHKLEGVGYELGLPLETIRNRGPEAILLAILDPNREIQPQYLNYVAVTDAGLSFTGMIAAETATSITLTRGEGASDTVLRTHIDELQNSGLSIMPEGLEKQIGKQQMADLIEYLMNVK